MFIVCSLSNIMLHSTQGFSQTWRLLHFTPIYMMLRFKCVLPLDVYLIGGKKNKKYIYIYK